MCRDDAENRPDDLSGDIGRNLAPCRRAAPRFDERDCGIEMRRDRSERRMSATSTAPVAMVFARSAMATLPPANRSPMIPEPTTQARSRAVPTASLARRRERVMPDASAYGSSPF